MTVTATAKPPKRPCGCAKKRQAMTEAQRLAAAIRDARMVGRASAAGSNQYYELAVVFDDTDGAFVLRAHGVSGTEEVSASGINNANAAVGAGCVRLDLRGSNSTSASMGYTDLYVRERADIESPGFHGPIELRLLDFEADVATDWTPDSGTDNYARISGAQREALASYIETNTLGDKDRYELGDLPAELNSIIAVIPVAVGLAPSGGAPQVPPA
jgi:hypothetical protein